ncbi:acyl-CoA dehydrogenase family protein [Pseudarthrobacter raffinosi]|uniref:acyl-CoA dehydrogenase family protein n=1 Tax=Pseudarthrobacter raffinosi TaxID=2953651 RepID=UPI00208E65DD|nr:acyl-CoA dehydrogenase family protein [Pseudarthrobacter sp. MDT3-9]MCO4253347.1 acyl-CoA dehydrogenase family protein [Pseudarthrobacter sp. MDT3-9]
MKRDIFDSDHEQYRDSIRSFIAKEVTPNSSAWDLDGIVPRDLFVKLGEMGALSFGVPEEYGGSGVDDFRYNVILNEEAARAGVSPALLGPILVTDICVPYIVGMGSEEQKHTWLPQLVSGEAIAAIAMTEPGTGSDLSGIKTKAVRDGDHYVVDGSKTFITNGINADVVITAVRTGEGRRDGLSLVLMERGMPGFERGRKLDKMGIHAQDTAELSFSAVRVPTSNLLGDEGTGFASLTKNLAQERLSLAAGAVASAAAALDWTISYVRERRAFGKTIGSQQNSRFQLAEMATEVDVAQAFVDRCITELNKGALTPVDAAKAKWWSTEMQGRVLDRCVQLHGGYGYMHEYPVARAWADGRATRIYGGTTEIMKDLIGRSMQLG